MQTFLFIFVAGMSEADRITEVHRQENRVPGGHAAVGREAGRPFTHDKLH